MQQAFDQFTAEIRRCRELNVLFRHLKDDLHLLFDLSDLLRAEIVYSVSALDKLVHELIRIGMIDAFNNLRPKTSKFNGYTISFSALDNMNSFYNQQIASLQNPINFVGAPIPPPVFWFEQEIVAKHKALSFQEPGKIADGLSLIWVENYKWQKLAVLMATDEATVQTTLRNIVGRRNLIVHEADIDAATATRLPITEQDAVDSVNFIERLGDSIFQSVR